MAFDHIPKRIVSLQPSATVILAALGQLDRLTACTKYCLDVCPEIDSRGKVIIADSWNAKSSEILAARPDLVIAAVPYQEKSVVEILKSGARFLGLVPNTLEDIYADISVIAGMLGVSERGESIISGMQKEIAAVRERLLGKHRPRVFCEEWGKPIIASQFWVAELIDAAGGEVIAPAGKQVSAETIFSANPDVLIASWCGAGDRVPLEKIVHDRRWEVLGAVQDGKVFCIRDEFLNTPAPTLIQGLHALAAAIHPESFPPMTGLRCISDTTKFQGAKQSA